uniref:DUF4283 domain-containing protein n=1 Tax=Nelumbo nucifera TaxID=4432 RepID=A0A822XVF9_NELNU|nr:TPA_asm: hypothetical protein HUJ06_025794 [Nelumbo nucifera]
MGDGRRQVICLPDGMNGQGWTRVAKVLQEYVERCWLKKENSISLGTKKMSQIQVPDSQKQSLQSMSGRVVCTPRLVLGGCKEDWSKKMVVLKKKKVVDWKRILNDVTFRIPTLDSAVLDPFDNNKVMLDLGNFQAEFMTLETLEGTVTVANSTPCNETSIPEGSVRLKVFGLPFNLWLDHVFNKVATACGGVLEDICIDDLYMVKIKVTDANLHRILRLIDLFAEGRWRKLWVAMEDEAFLWNGGKEVEDDFNWI